MSEQTATPEGTEEGTAPATEAAASGTPAPPEPATQGHGEGSGSTGEGATPGGTPAPESSEPAFFDRKEFEQYLETAPAEVSGQLRALYGNLNKAFTQKSQSIASERQKVEAYNAFEQMSRQDPIAALRAIAQQLGVTPQQAQQIMGQQERDLSEGFETWDEATEHISQKVLQNIRTELAPVFQNVQQLTTNNIEKQLDSIDPQWRVYEDTMMSNLKEHPTLVSDIGKLYRLSVPEEVHQQRATKEALKRVDAETKAATVTSGGGPKKTTGQTPKIESFDDAVAAAKADLEARGAF